MNRSENFWKCVAALGLFWTALWVPAAMVAQTFPFTADATYYSAIDAGNCSFGTIGSGVSPFRRIVAVGTPLYDGSAACGRFIEIDTTDATCPGPPCNFTGSRVVVMVSDQLPSASPNLDLSEPAFGDLAPLVAGVLENVRWRYVPGEHAGNIELHTTASINSFFLHFVLHDHNLGITQVEVRDALDPTWYSAARDTANQWSVSLGQQFQAPLSVRVTDVDGGVVTSIDTFAAIAPSAIFDLGVQLAPAPSVPSGDVAGPVAIVCLAAVGGGAVLWVRRRM